MWKCPVCEKENETLLCGCGFDGSMDYEAWPTFGQLGAVSIEARAAKRTLHQKREESLLKCPGCGGSTFVYQMEQAAFQCLRCGRELAWEEIPRVPAGKTDAKPIASRAEYLEALEQRFLEKGKQMLSQKEIEDFLEVYDLRNRLGVRAAHVEKDLREIAEKYVPSQKQVNSYLGYQAALEELFLAKGKRKLSRAEIQAFLNAHDLPRRFGISVYDVEQDLTKIGKKHAVVIDNTPVKQVSNYPAYLEALEKLYLKNGKHALSRAEIQTFLNTYELPRRFGISVYDVEQDLRKIAEKYVPYKEQINSYMGYLAALEELFLKNGKQKLSTNQIFDFLEDHDLRARFGITVTDVEKDLRKIEEKHGAYPKQVNSYSGYPGYQAGLEKLFLENGKRPLSRTQISDFLDTYNLRARFGITVTDVEKDLQKITEKYS